MGRMRLNAASPAIGSRAIRISSVPYAEEEMPSGDGTAQGERLGQPLLAELLVDERRAKSPAFRRIPEAPRQVDALFEHIDRLAHGHRSVPFPSWQSD